MASTPILDAITLVLDLIAAPLVLEVLEGLGRDLPPGVAVPPGSNPADVDAAVAHLVKVGAAVISTDLPTGPRPVLTARGRRLLDALERADTVDPEDAPGPNV